jgi:PAS domain-containing protein
VTERRRAESALRASEKKYRGLIQSLPAAVYTCDRRGRIELFNEAAIELWGREPEVGKDMWCGSWRIYHPDGSPLELDDCPMARTLKDGTGCVAKRSLSRGRMARAGMCFRIPIRSSTPRAKSWVP